MLCDDSHLLPEEPFLRELKMLNDGQTKTTTDVHVLLPMEVVVKRTAENNKISKLKRLFEMTWFPARRFEAWEEAEELA